MGKWYNSLNVPELIFFWIAVVGTVLLIIQIVSMLFSFGGGDASPDGDFGGDGDFDTPEGGLDIALFTLKGITAFLSFGGWTGLLVLQLNEKNLVLSIILSLVVGLLSMFIIALVMKGLSKLQNDGTLNKNSLLGKEATVYVSIAPNRSGRGKITFVAQGAYTETNAITDENERIPVDTKVVITEIGDDYMVVERIKKNNSEDK